MRLPELRKLLQELHGVGFVPSERRGPTGIGHTLEAWLCVAENNLPIPDIGGRTEVKATRSATNSLITLFTFNRSVWHLSQAETVLKWGYYDEKKGRRPSLYSTVSASRPNPQGLKLALPESEDKITLIHDESGELLATWDLFHIVGKFTSKFERLLFVHAKTRNGKDGEEFHFDQAQLLSEPSPRTFRDSFLRGKAVIDIRMHILPNKAVRNHGTGFRVHEHDLPSLFGRMDNLLEAN